MLIQFCKLGKTQEQEEQELPNYHASSHGEQIKPQSHSKSVKADKADAKYANENLWHRLTSNHS